MTATLYLVRHGAAAASWREARDPGLSALGHDQAAKCADELAQKGPLRIISSPLRRARETAAALSSRTGIDVEIEPAISEIPSPMSDLDQRGPWLGELIKGDWPDHEPIVSKWRAALVAFLCAQPRDSVIFSHFMAINAAWGAAQHSARVLQFQPDYCSITLIGAGEPLTPITKGDNAELLT